MEEGNEFPSIIEYLQDFTTLMEAFAKVDACYAFYFCAMDERCRKYFRVTIGDKRYEWNVVPYGVHSMPAHYQKELASILSKNKITAIMLNHMDLPCLLRRECS
jgi:hypothetical protein